MKKLTIVLALILILTLAIGTYAYAAGVFTKQVNSTVTVLELVPGLEVYSDNSTTTPVTTMDFGGVKPGQSGAVTVYVKNTGDLPFSTVHLVTWQTGDVPLSFGSMAYSTNDFALAVGNVQPVTFTLSISGGATSGAKPFYSKVNGTY